MTLIPCYNRGCGKDFDPENNAEDSCRYHPGVPYFHDAYKGWSCCKKKSVDFTEFLNIKGCEVSKHSNQKPSEPEKPKQEIVIEEPAPMPSSVTKLALKRVDFNSPLTLIKPNVAPALKQTIDNFEPGAETKFSAIDSSAIPVGTVCKNGGCGAVYQSAESDRSICCYHPGSPIFHEGMKFWSCCQKRTTDFAAFLNQKGCSEGQHKWIQSKEDTDAVQCRYDWHQTATNVVIAIYAKSYHYAKSFVKVNPIRLDVSLIFPLQNDAAFTLNLELRGVIDVERTAVQFLGTKVEIKLVKAEPGSWAKLDFPRAVQQELIEQQETKKEETKTDTDSDVDLDDIEAMNAVTIKDI
ncbi:Cysteine and histidine-rich domain-containing protein morgana [Pseudolycoriella hygida]|uniref:Cysteine and histidine-rich domain-containing protein morgana n=1 Tax=Pseudolycoriella hygida TaxID=35572 RepID=A0A9Q0RZB0_9DIPT|nr:Cysteine and histidine-rich domain-containing protein morgana [Pseudolycoriella hygida]